MSPTLAIDFGSTRTKIAYFCPDERKPRMVELGEEIRAVMPSVFYIPPTGNVLVGDRAAQMADEDPAGIVVDIKREIHRPGKIRCGEGRVPYQRWELVAALFSEIRRRCGNEVFHNGSIEHCTLTVPVCFSEPQRQKLQQAAQQAGFTRVRILDEPIAAAMHWLAGSGKKHSDHVIVVDVGGGTTDLAALKLTGHTYEPIPDLPSSGFPAGGNDIDEEVRRSMQQGGYHEEHAGALLMKLRQVKERLRMDRDDFVIHLAGNKQSVTRLVVEAAVRTLIEKTCAATASFLKDFEEVTGRSDTPVLLAGGGSKLPGMKEALEGVAGKGRVFAWNDCEYAIALGATLADVPAPSAVGNPTPDENSPPDNSSSHAEMRSKLLNQMEAVFSKVIDIDRQRELVTAAMVEACELEASRGNSRAQALLAHCFAEGCHVAINPARAVWWCQQSVNQNDALGQALLGVFYRDGEGVCQSDTEAAKWFLRSADQGCTLGQNCLGLCYVEGKGVAQNQTRGANWFRLSADQGDALGQCLLGACYVEGAGVNENHTEAVKWLRLSADQGLASAQSNLGEFYFNGYGGTQNYSEAVKWLRLAADQGDASAQYNLGLCYFNGYGVIKNYTEAVKWFRLAADQGFAVGQYNLGHCFRHGYGVPQNHTEAVKWFRLAADQGDADGQNALGVFYFNGYGGTQNFSEAVKWFRLAADQGDADGQNYLGCRYLDGKGVPQNHTEAVKWFRLSADQGHASGQCNLGHCFSNGLGVPQNHTEAVRWFRLSADQGHASGQCALGHCFLNGLGVPQNHTEAVRWFRLSADQGFAVGQYNLGHCFRHGYGVSQNHTEASKWFRLAAEQGNASAINALNVLQ